MDETVYKKGAIAGFACKHLSPEDCSTHPNCQWVKEFLHKKTGKAVSAHCGAKARPVKLTRKSPKRTAGGKVAAGKNTWVAEVKRVQAETGMSYKDAMSEASRRRQAATGQVGGGNKREVGYGPTFAGRTAEQGGCVGYKTRAECLAEEARACRWLDKKNSCANPVSSKVMHYKSPKRVSGASKNSWIQRVKAHAEASGLSYKDAMKALKGQKGGYYKWF